MEREQIDLAISELESRLDRLRALYEHYFMGIERVEPSVPRKDVERRVADLRKARFQSTAQRFKFQTIVQRYNTMQQHWSRICREIELGTFRRHRLKAERAFDTRPASLRAPPADARETAASETRASGSGPEPRAPLDSFVDGEFPVIEAGTGTSASALREEASAAGKDPDTATAPGGVLRRLGTSGANPVNKPLLAGLPPDLRARPGVQLPPLPEGAAAVPRRPAPPPAAAPPPAPPRPPAAAAPAPAKAQDQPLPEARVRALHQAYVDARKQTNASAVSFEKLERSLRETESKLRSSHQGRKIDFEVVIKDGRAILKPKLS